MAADMLARVHVLVPDHYIRNMRTRGGPEAQKRLLQDVQARVARLGATTTFAALQDPTQDGRIAVIAGRSPRIGATDGVIRVVSQTPVAAPAATDSAPALDSGLTADEAASIAHALFRDVDPRHVGDGGLPTVLDPFYPASASLLRAKGELLEKNVRFTADGASRLLCRAMKEGTDAALEAAREAFVATASRSPLPIAVWRDRARAAISRFSKNASDSLSDHLPAVAELAKQVVRVIEWNDDSGNSTYHLRIVPPRRLAAALPSRPEDGFVSPSALQLALALQKPKWSNVGMPAQIGRAAAAQQGAPSVARTRVQHQMERAGKAIDRRRWVEWYRHHRRLNISSL